MRIARFPSLVPMHFGLPSCPWTLGSYTAWPLPASARSWAFRGWHRPLWSVRVVGKVEQQSRQLVTQAVMILGGEALVQAGGQGAHRISVRDGGRVIFFLRGLPLCHSVQITGDRATLSS